jgi:hypothetical protein
MLGAIYWSCLLQAGMTSSLRLTNVNVVIGDFSPRNWNFDQEIHPQAWGRLRAISLGSKTNGPNISLVKQLSENVSGFFLIFISFLIISTIHHLRPGWPLARFPIGASQMACERHHMCPIVKVMKVHTRRHSSKEVLHCLYFFVEYLEFVFELVIVFVIVNMQGHIVESTFQLAYAEFWRHKQEMSIHSNILSVALRAHPPHVRCTLTGTWNYTHMTTDMKCAPNLNHMLGCCSAMTWMYSPTWRWLSKPQNKRWDPTMPQNFQNNRKQYALGRIHSRS